MLIADYLQPLLLGNPFWSCTFNSSPPHLPYPSCFPAAHCLRPVVASGAWLGCAHTVELWWGVCLTNGPPGHADSLLIVSHPFLLFVCIPVLMAHTNPVSLNHSFFTGILKSAYLIRVYWWPSHDTDAPGALLGGGCTPQGEGGKEGGRGHQEMGILVLFDRRSNLIPGMSFDYHNM